MSATAIDAISARLDEVDGELKVLESDYKAAKKSYEDGSKQLKSESTLLRKTLADLQRIAGVPASTNGHGAAQETEEISLDELLAAVNAGGSEPRSSQQIAEAMGTTPRKIARKLRKLADDGKIGGNKDDGWHAL